MKESFFFFGYIMWLRTVGFLLFAPGEKGGASESSANLPDPDDDEDAKAEVQFASAMMHDGPPFTCTSSSQGEIHKKFLSFTVKYFTLNFFGK